MRSVTGVERESLERGAWSVKTLKRSKVAPSSRNMGAFSTHIDGIERLTGGHEKSIPLFAAETEVGADLRQQDHSDSFSVRGENVHAIIAFAHPSSRRPEIPIDIDANAIGAAKLSVQLHRTEAPLVLELYAV